MIPKILQNSTKFQKLLTSRVMRQALRDVQFLSLDRAIHQNAV